MTPDLNALQNSLPQLEALTIEWGTKIAITLAVAIIGWIGAGWVENGIEKTFSRVKNSDPMLVGFFSNLARWVVLVVTGLAVLDRVGIQTTSIVTILGAAGLAIGLALQGTLSSLSAGIMLLLFRPFRVGDSVETPAISGTIKAVSLFHTELITADNVQVIAPNSVLWGVTLKNTSHYPDRRITFIVPISIGSDAELAIQKINRILSAETRLAPTHTSEVAILRFNSTDKVTEIEVHVWADQAVHTALKADLLAAIWRDVLKA